MAVIVAIKDGRPYIAWLYLSKKFLSGDSYKEQSKKKETN